MARPASVHGIGSNRVPVGGCIGENATCRCVRDIAARPGFARSLNSNPVLVALWGDETCRRVRDIATPPGLARDLNSNPVLVASWGDETCRRVRDIATPPGLARDLNSNPVLVASWGDETCRRVRDVAARPGFARGPEPYLVPVGGPLIEAATRRAFSYGLKEFGRRASGIIRSRDRADDRDSIGSDLAALCRALGGDAADGDHREVDGLAHRRQAFEPDRLGQTGLRARRPDGSDPEVCGAGPACGPRRLGVAARAADDRSGGEEPSRDVDRQVVGAEVNPVGAHGLRDVDAVVDEAQRAVRVAERGDRGGEVEGRAVGVVVLGPDLDEASPGRQRGGDH